MTSHERARLSDCHATVLGGGGWGGWGGLGGGGGNSHFFFIRRLWPSITPRKISGVSNTPPPQKNEILATKKIFPILYLDFIKDPKMHRNVP